METMYYYEFVSCENGDHLGIYSSTQRLDFKSNDLKKPIVVVASCDELITAQPLKQINSIKALSMNSDIEEIVCVVDTTRYYSRLNALQKMYQIENILEKRMEKIKYLDTLRKFANKDSGFNEMLKQYELLMMNSEQTELSIDNDEEGDEIAL